MDMDRIMVGLVVLCMASTAHAQSSRADQEQTTPIEDTALVVNNFRGITESTKGSLDALDIWRTEQEKQYQSQRAFAGSPKGSTSPLLYRPNLTTQVRMTMSSVTEEAGGFWDEHPKEIALVAIILLVAVVIL